MIVTDESVSESRPFEADVAKLLQLLLEDFQTRCVNSIIVGKQDAHSKFECTTARGIDASACMGESCKFRAPASY